jgi:hypothetical protein
VTRAGYSWVTGADPGFHLSHKTMAKPLLSVGTFGVHIIEGDRGYSFVGTVPVGIKVGIYPTIEDGIAAFVAWFKGQDVDFQRKHVADLRNDVFALLLAA